MGYGRERKEDRRDERGEGRLKMWERRWARGGMGEKKRERKKNR